MPYAVCVLLYCSHANMSSSSQSTRVPTQQQPPHLEVVCMGSTGSFSATEQQAAQQRLLATMASWGMVLTPDTSNTTVLTPQQQFAVVNASAQQQYANRVSAPSPAYRWQ